MKKNSQNPATNRASESAAQAKPENIQLTFGADPEIFIYDNEEKRIVSAIPVVKRDKYDPHKLDEHVNFYFDNCMGEFTVKPAASKEEFIKNIGNSLKLINEFLIGEYKNRYSIKIQAAHEFDPEFLEHEDALKIGCNPEYNADTVSDVVPPDFSGNLRSAGAHYAIGSARLSEDHFLSQFQTKIDLVKLFDYFVAIPFTLIDTDSTSAMRRKIYGKKASHRPKDAYGSLGVEYRVLSNFWLNSPKLVGLIYDLASYSIERLLARDYQKIVDLDYKLAAAAIQENNKELAQEILDMIEFPKTFLIRLNQIKDTKWEFHKEWELNSKTFANSVASF